jgi:hypothetical protein
MIRRCSTQRNSRGPWSRRVRIDPLRASQRLVSEAVAGSSACLASWLSKDERWIFYTMRIYFTRGLQLCEGAGQARG